MASKRDLIEAHDFNRRRLVTAFVSGAPQGREVESASRLKPVIAGLVICALMVGGAALLGVFQPLVPPDWDKNKVVISQETNAMYVALDGIVRPVPNQTSARLALPPGSAFEMVRVPDYYIKRARQGDVVGIADAPTSLPVAAELVQERWTACLTPQGVSDSGVVSYSTVLWLDPALELPSSGASAAVVRSPEGDYYLLMGGRRYPIRSDESTRKAVTRMLAVDEGAERTYPAEFLRLHPQGPALDFPALEGVGDASGWRDARGEVIEVGDLVHSPNNPSDIRLVTVGGKLAKLTPFAAAVYKASRRGEVRDLELTEALLLKMPTTDRLVTPSGWPTEMPVPLGGPAHELPCAVMQMSDNQDTVVTGAIAKATDQRFERKPRVNVVAGGGALVVASETGRWHDRAAGANPVSSQAIWYLVDQTGRKYSIAREVQTPDAVRDTLGLLGYDAGLARPVLASWTDLLSAGDDLSHEAAMQQLTNVIDEYGDSASPTATP